MAYSEYFTYGVRDIILRLGQEKHPNGRVSSAPWRRKHIAALIKNAGFPHPLPSGSRLTVCNRSRWLREAVDQWFEGQNTPEGLAAAHAAAAREAAADMDGRAGNLKLIQGGRAHAA